MNFILPRPGCKHTDISFENRIWGREAVHVPLSRTPFWGGFSRSRSYRSLRAWSLLRFSVAIRSFSSLSNLASYSSSVSLRSSTPGFRPLSPLTPTGDRVRERELFGSWCFGLRGDFPSAFWRLRLLAPRLRLSLSKPETGSPRRSGEPRRTGGGEWERERELDSLRVSLSLSSICLYLLRFLCLSFDPCRSSSSPATSWEGTSLATHGIRNEQKCVA
jgi:hypothetical protein